MRLRRGRSGALTRRPPAAPLVAGAVLLAFLLLPVAVLVWRGAIAAAAGAFVSHAVLDALRVTAVTTLAALAITVSLGTPVAYVLARYDFPGRDLLDAVLDLPVVLPPVVAGLGLLFAFGRRGVLGPTLDFAGVQLAFSPAAVVLAQVFVSAPYYLRGAKAGFLAADRDLVAVASLDGATRAQAFRLVTLPLAAPFLLEGATLAWARALGEFGATILFAGSLPGRTRTVTLAVYAALDADVNAALALSGLLCVVAFAVLAAVRVIASRRAKS